MARSRALWSLLLGAASLDCLGDAFEMLSLGSACSDLTAVDARFFFDSAGLPALEAALDLPSTLAATILRSKRLPEDGSQGIRIPRWEAK